MNDLHIPTMFYTLACVLVYEGVRWIKRRRQAPKFDSIPNGIMAWIDPDGHECSYEAWTCRWGARKEARQYFKREYVKPAFKHIVLAEIADMIKWPREA